jgi:hypothetical protein
METYYIDQVEIGILKGKLADPIRGDKPYQTIATDDIGAFVALAFGRPAEFIGKELEIAGSELTNPEAAKVFSRVLGKPVKFQKLPLLLVRLVLGKEFYTMFRWFIEAGFQADIPGLRRAYPRSIFTPLRSGCETKAGTSARRRCALQGINEHRALSFLADLDLRRLSGPASAAPVTS